MTKETKRKWAQSVRELYLYPYYSKGENIVRGLAWIASWIVGIAVQTTKDQRILGGAYFIFAVSLLLEFIPQGRSKLLAQVIHGIFCGLLVFILVGAFFIIFGPTNVAEQSQNWIANLLTNAPYTLGWIVFCMIILGVILAVFDVHKVFLDEEAVAKQEAKMNQTAAQEQFMNNLKRQKEGGGSQ